SLHVTWRQGHRGGGVLLYCHGCQAQASHIVEALGLTMADLFDDPLPERDRSLLRSSRSTQRRRSGQRRGKLGPLPAVLTRQKQPEVVHDWVEVERYPYTTAEGTLVQEVIREECECPDDPDGGGRHKQFRQLFVTSTGRRVKRKP